jgi:hypothetical protein
MQAFLLFAMLGLAAAAAASTPRRQPARTGRGTRDTRGCALVPELAARMLDDAGVNLWVDCVGRTDAEIRELVQWLNTHERHALAAAMLVRLRDHS